MKIKYHNDDKIPLEDQMLLSLYRKYLDNGNDGFFAYLPPFPIMFIGEMLLTVFMKKSFIEYPDSLSLSTIGRITQEEINHIKKTYG